MKNLGGRSVTVRTESAKASGTGWLSSGEVVFRLMDVPDASLTFPYVDAPDEEGAKQQAARKLAEAAEAFTLLASEILAGRPR
jgi:hypothetical protein